MTEPTTLASWTRALRKQLDALGLDSITLCQTAGLDPLLMDDPAARYPITATTRLWQLAVQASGDPAIGLRVSRFISPTAFDALGYALVASGTLQEVFERIVQYHQVASDILRLELRRTEERYQFRFCVPEDTPEPPAAEAIDAFAAIYVRTCRNRLGHDYAPLMVHLQRPQPLDPQPWHEVFRAPIVFAAKENLLEFACTDIDGPLEDGTSALAGQPATVLKYAFEHLKPMTWERRVRAAIEAQLPDGEPSVDDIARTLHLKPRSLRRHLADEGFRYDLLLNQCRQNLAIQHMGEPRTLVSEIACLVGFPDASSFSRAFKRWTGMTPGQYRDELAR